MEDQLKQLFIELVKFTKTVSPEIWAILVKQHIVLGCMYLVSFVIPIIGFLTGMHLFKTNPAWAMDSDNDNIVAYGATIISIIVGVILTIVILTKGLPYLLNPEYYALMSLKP